MQNVFTECNDWARFRKSARCAYPHANVRSIIVAAASCVGVIAKHDNLLGRILRAPKNPHLGNNKPRRLLCSYNASRLCNINVKCKLVAYVCSEKIKPVPGDIIQNRITLSAGHPDQNALAAGKRIH